MLQSIILKTEPASTAQKRYQAYGRQDNGIFMRKYIKQIIFLSFFILFCKTSLFAEDIQQSSLDGLFYPKDQAVLKGMVSGFIQQADIAGIQGDVIAIVSPHAGYQYSGKTAGFGFKAIMDKGFSTAIIVASSHRHYFKGLSVLDRDAYITPLGRVYIDKDITRKLLLYDDRIKYHPQPFFNENSIETQIPFIQYALPEAKIVIVLMGDQSYDTCLLLRDALHDMITGRKDIVIIASTDMSHFSDENRARLIDTAVIKQIQQFQPEDLFLYISGMENKDRPCGATALVSTILAAKKLGANKINVLNYATSADVTGDKSSVVGYMSAVIVETGKENSKDNQHQKEAEQGMDNLLSAAQKSRLLEIARASIENYIRKGEKTLFKESDKVLNDEMGAFVSLYKHGLLRGCIGNIIGQGPLHVTVAEMAIQSAVKDPRFAVLKEEELEDIDIEISVLSPLEKIDDPDKIVMGRHGVLVKSGFKSGVYLPQVATETGWSRDEFMDSLCMHKAGISKDSWRSGKCDIYIFSAEVFGDKE
jgi:MEMO1 family protein